MDNLLSKKLGGPTGAPNWSPLQQAFFSGIKEQEDSLVLDARAGSGKTTTLVQGAQSTLPGLALAFNKRNADDLSKRLPSAWHAKTMNSLGHTAWARHIDKRLNLQVRKSWELIQDISIPFKNRQDVVRAVGMAKALGVLPTGVPEGVYQSPYTWEDVFELADVDDAPALRDWATQLLQRSIRVAWSGSIDFDDQIYMSVIYGAPIPKYLTLIVDEAQDLSDLQHQMALRALHSSGRALLAGDVHQAIYAWRGADANSLASLREHFVAVPFPLTVSYRCPKAVIAEAQRFVPDITAAETAPDGERRGDFNRPLESLPLSDFQQGATVLCRYNAPLIHLAFQLLRRGIPATILGRDFFAGIRSYIKKHSEGGTIQSMLAAITEDTRAAVQAARAVDNENKVARLNDRKEAIVNLIEGIGFNVTIDKFLQRVDELFSDSAQNARVVLSTIHKAKGMEWPNVIFMGPEKLRLDEGQETNLAYVAVTRAQQKLTYVTVNFKIK